jgi:hypothetical protein
MSVLLRHPAIVPALFSRAVEPDPRVEGASTLWSRVVDRAPLAIATIWTVVVLIEVPLVKAAAAAVGLALPR